MNVKTRTLLRGNLVPIALETLCTPLTLDFDLFLRHGTSSPLLYRERGLTIEASELERLKENDVRTLYLHSDDAARYCEFLREHVVQDETLSPIRRYELLKHASREIMHVALDNGDADQLLPVAKVLSQQIVNLLWQRNVVLVDLLGVVSDDFSNYAHLSNVCTYAVLLAKLLGISDPASLAAIGQGALLHDVGKKQIPPEILNKKERLTPKERAIYRSHPQRGFEELCFRDDLEWGQLMMVYQHHEMVDGRGYPMGLPGDEIHEWARICAIADTFDLLTRAKTRSTTRLHGDAREYLERQAGHAFDKEMVQCWIETLNNQ